MHGEPTSRSYDAELNELRRLVLRMGATVGEMIANSIAALAERDAVRAQRAIERDRDVDRLELEIDRLCLRIFARRQPVASDLRLLAAVVKLVKDLARMGDCARNICSRTLEVMSEPPLVSSAEMVRMAQTAREMLMEALAAFIAEDAERAKRLIARDTQIDEAYTRIGRELLASMASSPRGIAIGIQYHAIAKYLERIGDHAKNLGELVVFMVGGRDIRHGDGHEGTARAPAPPRKERGS